jgi:1,4-beta-D-xylan synthase
MAPPQAPASGGCGGVAGGTATSSVLEVESNNGGAGAGHNGVDGGGAASSAAANGNGKQRAEKRVTSKKTKKAAVSPKDKYWTPIDGKEAAAALEDGGEDGRRPLLFRTYRVKGILLHPYRYGGACVCGRPVVVAYFVLAAVDQYDSARACSAFSQARGYHFGGESTISLVKLNRAWSSGHCSIVCK